MSEQEVLELERTEQVSVMGSPMPMLALRGMTMFPQMLLHFDVERPQSTSAITAALAGDQKLFLCTQKNIMDEHPRYSAMYKVGTICEVKQVLRVPGQGMRVMVEGLERGHLLKIVSYTPHYLASVRPEPEETDARPGKRLDALCRKCHTLFEEYAELVGLEPEYVAAAMSSDDPGYLCDFIAQNTGLKYSDKQAILETLKLHARVSALNDILSREISILSMKNDLMEKTNMQMMSSQREYFLKEQLKVIRAELGESDEVDSELETYGEQIIAMGIPDQYTDKLMKELGRLAKQPWGSSEAAVLRTYFDTVLELPWNKKKKETNDIVAARSVLDADHFGLEKVKERIIEHLAVKQLTHDANVGILCLIGPPGVGKTSVATSVASAMGRDFARISLGGIHDEAEIRGHRKTYVGAMPGRIMAAVKQAGSKNPVILLDEVDKLGSDYRGDPSAALLEALDPEQNKTFRDHYLEIPFDLSDVLFITTANTDETIPRPLLDRMEVIELGSYTDEEKLEIAKRHLLPKQRRRNGLKANQLKLGDDTIRDLIAGYTRESGVRQMERELSRICRKVAVKIAEGEGKSFTVNSSKLEAYLGVRKYRIDALSAYNEVGTVKGLAWTRVGGEILEVEVNVLDGTGKLNLTGNLGDVMKESAQAALSYIRSRATLLGIDPSFYKEKDIHIHFPEGGVPKDGPSAGITIAIAAISALTNIPVRRDIAMTGEITLRGRVLPIGGLREKTMAALRSHVNTVIIPAENEKDLEEIDQTVRNALNFVTAGHIDDILNVALELPEGRGIPRVLTPPPVNKGDGTGAASITQ